MMKIGVFGATGRVGKLLLEEIKEDKSLELGSIFIRKELNISLSKDILVTNDLKTFVQNSDIIIDFSLPEATKTLLSTLSSHPKPIVCGTTGLGDSELKTIDKLSKSMPILYATNMSQGIAMLGEVATMLSRTLKEADIEICEIHHRYKKDAPSGTALTLGQKCAKARGLDFDKIRISGRDGNIGQRSNDEIALMSLRGGDVAGRHTIGFYMDGEYIEITHNATSRLTFAKGALKAAKWLINQKNGLYDINDIF
ncbi:4-hydroxy-tetrahydrodipicolinate reductase [Helicobacter sp. 13S00482-2]|uniref:4-hydroxy-tetrahydrodipicolinate reductase n=1 Tax=Helicobacter sp. 13S00482-2 TaxID=1476200 RepID=UPI000BA7D75E|nr:4-hydroxy-tetrahydrodipicolinate reductase [Helicobacter sp. 13S00482-2]PAF54328.1 4-hydroxy-tetrahydrodipicolinate reductase [Helicobacter sp. 13S00482-2]